MLERHLKFGGAATIFRRKGMRIEVGLHEMDGLDKDDKHLHSLFQAGLLHGVAKAIKTLNNPTYWNMDWVILNDRTDIGV